MITLYEFALSGNCHKIRLMLSLLGLNYQSVAVNGSEQQQKSAEFLAMNPFGPVQVLKDDDVVIRDSQAIMKYTSIERVRRHLGETKKVNKIELLLLPNRSADFRCWLKSALLIKLVVKVIPHALEHFLLVMYTKWKCKLKWTPLSRQIIT